VLELRKGECPATSLYCLDGGISPHTFLGRAQSTATGVLPECRARGPIRSSIQTNWPPASGDRDSPGTPRRKDNAERPDEGDKESSLEEISQNVRGSSLAIPGVPFSSYPTASCPKAKGRIRPGQLPLHGRVRPHSAHHDLAFRFELLLVLEERQVLKHRQSSPLHREHSRPDGGFDELGDESVR
jgi:hypothetical protein